LKLNDKRCSLDVAKFFFSIRVINKWNMLSEETIAGNSFTGLIENLIAIRDMSGDFIS